MLVRAKVEAAGSGHQKQCGRCGERKGAAGFLRDPTTFDGLAPVCSSCAALTVGASRAAAEFSTHVSMWHVPASRRGAPAVAVPIAPVPQLHR